MLILASTSPRRKEILSFFKIPFHIMSPNFDELSIPYELDPIAYVKKIAEGKAEAINKLHLGMPVLAADTIVVKKNKLYLKPSNLDEAMIMLKELCGHQHQVLTATTMQHQNTSKTIVTSTNVEFHAYNEKEIQNYINSVPILDKSGSYAIQGIGSLIVKKIEGCFYNVMGLPISSVSTLLKEFGFDIWDHLKIYSH